MEFHSEQLQFQHPLHITVLMQHNLKSNVDFFANFCKDFLDVLYLVQPNMPLNCCRPGTRVTSQSRGTRGRREKGGGGGSGENVGEKTYTHTHKKTDKKPRNKFWQKIPME